MMKTYPDNADGVCERRWEATKQKGISNLYYWQRWSFYST